MQEPYNISLYPGTGSVDGRRGDHVLLAPAYTVSEKDIRHIVEITEAVVRQFFRRYYDQILVCPKGIEYSVVSRHMPHNSS